MQDNAAKKEQNIARWKVIVSKMALSSNHREQSQ